MRQINIVVVKKQSQEILMTFRFAFCLPHPPSPLPVHTPFNHVRAAAQYPHEQFLDEHIFVGIGQR